MVIAAQRLTVTGNRRTTSVSWPVEVDERLRLLARLSARQWSEQRQRDPGADNHDCPPPSTPSAARVLVNLILSQSLTDVAYLGQEPSAAVLAEVGAVNDTYSWLDREPWLGRPRERIYEDTPHRIVLRRAKGFQLPANTISVARPSRWGNPWRILPFKGNWYVEQPRGIPQPYDNRARAHTAATELFGVWLDGDLGHVDKVHNKQRQRILDELATLRGKNLACYCLLDLDCHGDELLARANRS